MQFIDFYNNPNVGLFFYTTDKVTIAPQSTPEKTIEIIKSELKTKVIKCDVYSTSVVSIFLAGNEEYLFAPNIISAEEKKCLETAGLKLVLVDTKFNALGNNMVFHGKNVLINPHFEPKVSEQLKKLGFSVSSSNVAGVETVGANVVILGENALVNPDAKKEELEAVEKGLKVNADFGTVNGGSKIVKAGIVANSHGVLVSNLMSGAELMRVEELIPGGEKGD